MFRNYLITIEHLNIFFDFKENEFGHLHSKKNISIQKILKHQGHLSILKLYLNLFASFIKDLMHSSKLISFINYFNLYFTNY